MFDQLREFKRREGHCDVPAKYRPNQDLAGWVVRLRVSHDAGKLAPEKVRRLQEIGFGWTPLDAQWEQRFDELKSFREHAGHCCVPQRYPSNPQLATWVAQQRGRRATLSSERIEKLESIGFDWDPFESFWQRQFEALQSFKKREGHCNVPEDYEQDRELDLWIHNQRACHRRGTLSRARVAKLNVLGFDWDPYETYWQRMFSELKAFKKQEGHCNVPARYRENPPLGAWVYAQRGRFRKGTLPLGKIQELASIGFEWEPFESMWQMMFEKLNAFHSREGHCRVPCRQATSRELAHWVSTQRQFYRKGKLSQERIRKLESIDFQWEPASDSWEQMYEELKAFRRKQGHCSVPRKDRHLLKLAAWVLNQRRLFGKGKISKEQIRKLAASENWNPLGPSVQVKKHSSTAPAKERFETMPRFEPTYAVQSKTYVAIFHTAWHLLDMSERHEEGRLLNLQAATVFFAFSFEAYLNHVGAEELTFWEEVDRISHAAKLEVLSKHLGFAKDKSKPPFQMISELFKLRDALAHGRTQNVTIKNASGSPPPYDAVERLLPWEQLTPQGVRRYHDDVRDAIELINSARPWPDKLVWNEGSRSSTISGGK